MAAKDTPLRDSLEELWYLKEISFRPNPDEPAKQFSIITQNFNGPCSFIAICNILILRGQIEILPPDRKTVSYDFLSRLVSEYLLSASTDTDLSAALSTMPVTRKGMDLNPLFTGATAFRPAGAGGELKLFEQAGIKLVHGWLVDPESHEHAPLAKTEDYDTSVNLIVEADHLSKGRLVAGEAYVLASPAEPGEELAPEERQKIEDAIVIRNFLESTQSQLTYHGLFTLASTLAPGELVALFRNSHLSVLYKAPGEDAALYTLATDQVFLREPSVVWERLDDVDGSSSSFVDSEFVRSSPAGGDYAGHTGESALRALEAQAARMTVEDDADMQLAQRLQAEEDERAREAFEQREKEERDREALRRLPASDQRKSKKKGDCIIM